jgi:hypothetical protein
MDERHIPRFWRKVDVRGSGECWEWQGWRDVAGSGRFDVDHNPLSAHRVSYELANGPIGKMFVCHSCDNRGCVNPSHLWLGTGQQNTADRNAKARQARGERQGAAKLTAADVPEIVRRRRAGETQRSIALDYGVDKKVVYNIEHGLSWIHITSGLDV